MKNTKILSFLIVPTFFLVLCPHDLFAFGENAMQCPPRGSSNMVVGCRINDSILAKSPAFDTKEDKNTYTVLYDFSCSPGFGPDTLDVRLVVGDVTERLDFGIIGQKVITGVGDLKLRDYNPDQTSGLLFSADCKLVITSEPKVFASPEQVAKWHNELTELQSRRSMDYDAEEGLKSLQLYYPAYFFIKHIADNFEQKLEGQTLIHLREEFAKNRDFVSNLIAKGGTIGLASPEIMSLVNLEVALASLGSEQDLKNSDGYPKSLKDLLNESDKAVFHKLAEFAEQNVL